MLLAFYIVINHSKWYLFSGSFLYFSDKIKYLY